MLKNQWQRDLISLAQSKFVNLLRTGPKSSTAMVPRIFEYQSGRKGDMTKRDPIHSKLFCFVQEGWPSAVDLGQLKTYVNRVNS